MSSGTNLGGSESHQLHWSQRVALVRHQLHAASRSGVFTFFKILQAKLLWEGTNHVATIYDVTGGDEADALTAAIDNLNVGLAYVYQDAFKNVYDRYKESIRDDSTATDKSRTHVDIAMQRNMATMAIDKMTGSAIGLINQQPLQVQLAAANAWIGGVSIVADAMETVLDRLDRLDSGKLGDFIRLEESWDTVNASVASAITGLRGIFSLMDPSDPGRQMDKTTRSSSIASASGAMFRRLSSAFASSSSTSNSTPPETRQSSISSNASPFNRNASVSSIGSNLVYRTPNYVRNSVSNGCPVSLPAHEGGFQAHHLAPVPATPANDQADPFSEGIPPSVVPPTAVTASGVTGEDLQRRRLSVMVS